MPDEIGEVSVTGAGVTTETSPPTIPIFPCPATQPKFQAETKTYIAEAVARDITTGLERRATVQIDAPEGSTVRVERRRSVVDAPQRGPSEISLPRDYNTGAELETIVTTLGIRKTHSPLDKILFLGILAGIWVAFAGMFAQQVVGGIPPDIRAQWPILPKLALAITFPIGIVFIVLFGGELFTGNTMVLVVAWLNKRVTTRQVLENWVIVFFANFFACAFSAYLLGYLTGLFEAEPFRGYVTAVATRKAHLPFYKAFLMAIPANALVCLSIFLGLAARDVTGKILGLYLPIATFAATGWEHVVANMYFISLGWMYGADVTAGLFARNLLAVGLGNIVGGGFLIGFSEYYQYHWHTHGEPTKHFGRWGRTMKHLTEAFQVQHETQNVAEKAV